MLPKERSKSASSNVQRMLSPQNPHRVMLGRVQFVVGGLSAAREKRYYERPFITIANKRFMAVEKLLLN